jgi:hypothetical protein
MPYCSANSSEKLRAIVVALFPQPPIDDGVEVDANLILGALFLIHQRHERTFLGFERDRRGANAIYLPSLHDSSKTDPWNGSPRAFTAARKRRGDRFAPLCLLALEAPDFPEPLAVRRRAGWEGQTLGGADPGPPGRREPSAHR